MPIKVVFYDAKPYDVEFFKKANEKFGFEIKFFPGHLTAETAALSAGCEAACVFVNDIVDAEAVEKFLQNGVKMIALRSAGYNNVDLKTIFQKIHVARVPAYSPHAVAEHAVALMLTLNRKTHRAYYRTRDSNFTLSGLMGFDMHGKTAGIIGTGQIGKIAIDILKGFGMNILAFDVFPDKKFAEEKSIRYVDLDTLYSQSDVISLHCPLTPENLHMVNKTSIGKMKHGVVLVNTGRGKLIDSRDLIEGLKTGKIGAAGLDVYEEETDYFFEDFSNSAVADDVLARLLTFPNVLVTAHQGFFTKEALTNIAETTLENIRRFFADGMVPNEICYQCMDRATCPRNRTGRCF